MAKSNQKAKKLADQDTFVLKGFAEFIATFDRIADGSEQTMPLLSSAMRHSIQIIKLYREAFNATKRKRI